MIIKSEFKILIEEMRQSRLGEKYLEIARNNFAVDLGVKLAPLFKEVNSWNTGTRCERLDIAIFTQDQFKDLYGAILNRDYEKAIEVLNSNIPEIKLDN